MVDDFVENYYGDSIPRIMFADDENFHLSGKVNRHKTRIRETKLIHEIVQHEQDSPKLKNMFAKFHGIK